VVERNSARWAESARQEIEIEKIFHGFPQRATTFDLDQIQVAEEKRSGRGNSDPGTLRVLNTSEVFQGARRSTRIGWRRAYSGVRRRKNRVKIPAVVFNGSAENAGAINLPRPPKKRSRRRP